MVKKLFFSIIAMALLSFAMHKYYVSITEADYNSDAQIFELSIKFIGHDLEKALNEAGVPELNLGTPEELKNADDYLLKYINKKLHFVVNEKSLTFSFVGKEVNDDDFIYCYVASDKIKKPKNITIKNTLLTEVFSGQKNAIYLNIAGNKHTFNFDKEKVVDSHQIQ